MLRSVLDKWARENEFQILKAESRLIVPLWEAKGCQFLYITVLDASGVKKEGWFKGGINLIVYSQEYEVIWKENK